MALESIDPTSGEVIATYEEMDAAEAARVIGLVHAEALRWRVRPAADRAALVARAGEVLRSRRDDLAGLMTREMGKTLGSARSEVEKCAWVCDYYAEHGPAFLAPEPVATDASSSFVTFKPLGVVLAVMPWNFPLWQVFRFAAPGLVAGNTGLLKHASNVQGCALAIEDVFRAAGLPEHAFRALVIGSRAVEGVIRDPRVAAVTLTGSTPAGRAVARTAGQMLKKTVLELGGSDPYVILEDADLERAVTACVTARLINNGQSCIAAKRFIVPEGIRPAFEERFVAEMAAKRMGDPMSPETDLGPQARPDLRDDLHRQVLESVAQGARCLLGGEIPPGRGAFYPATVLTDVRPGMPAADEELFGPVAAILPVADEDAAIALANASPFGLGAAVFTRDVERGTRIAAERLEAGCCFVNDFVRSDPRLPFGGVKESGYGRELSRYGIREFVNVKTVWVR